MDHRKMEHFVWLGFVAILWIGALAFTVHAALVSGWHAW